MRLVMTLLVRDEEDVIGANLDFHLSQGVDHFIVTDNLSSDDTAAVIKPYVEKGLATYLFESQDDYSQGEWVTRMSRSAAIACEADWVINSDADEFWMPTDESLTLKSALEAIPEITHAIVVPRFNCPPMGVESTGRFRGQLAFRERQSFNLLGDPLLPKVCHRAAPDIEVAQGNHSVARHGAELEAAPGPLHILHYPLRSYRQFENKIVKGGAAYSSNTNLHPGVGHVWRNLYKQWQAQGNLLQAYLRNVPSQQELEERVARGELIPDERVARTLNSAGG